ncbi:47c91e6f-87b2-4a70-8cbf-18eb58cfdb15 [Sclerotinia trifoliorum]|uniref:Spindle pole body component n=1 Tax=Sclerotinia trifoliorum TaxID=28548 RepID=A0A8H2VSB7_9HELO|nr:47c91e6f-87b2-4a70-8cbf-18eb58cfdb15 [Sclerotinia trifoliorum]
MAHLVKLGALTDELVTLITSFSSQSDSARFNTCRETALRALRHSNYNRTNQFDIADRLEGLDEKFRVYNEDPLADALKERLQKLPELKLKWTSEILHLLLELSNKPVSKSRIEDLELIKIIDPKIEPPLKWRDLVAEDPLLREKSIWRNVDFGADSSEDDDDGGFEDTRSELSELTGSTGESSLDDDNIRRPQDFIVNTLDEDTLNNLRKAQFWQKPPSVNGVQLKTVKKPITELQAVREVLFMFTGSLSSLFEMDSHDVRNLKPSKRYTFKHLTTEGYDVLMQNFATQGSALNILRAWVKQPQHVPLLQVLQSSISQRLMNFDTRLSNIERRFVAPPSDVVVSLLSLQNEIADFTKPLSRLTDLIKRIELDPYAHAFRYLEFLYDETCTSQMAGDNDMYEFMGKIFFQCFQIYLRPIRSWMEEGELSSGDNVFFVSEVIGNTDPSSIWQSRFKLRKTQTGVLHAPSFLQTAAERIFNTGKSVVVLKHLSQFESVRSKRMIEPKLDFDSVCNTKKFFLAPFSELFDVAFENWIKSKHHHTSNKLRQTLFDSCGLHSALDALAHVYFIADGISSSSFMSSVFDKLDTLDASWNDRFPLTELAQSTIGSHPSIISERLRLRIRPLSQRSRDINKCRRSVKVLSIIEPIYHLSWPIQIIITPQTIPSYQRIFTFLFQIRRSSHILSRERLISDRHNLTSTTDERSLYYALRTRSLWFYYTLYYYLTSLVLEQRSQKMHQDLQDVEDIDAMIRVHTLFVKRITDECLLGTKLEPIHKTIIKILDLGIKLEDAQAANTAKRKEALEKQQEILDLSLASLDLPPTPRTLKNSRMSMSMSMNTRMRMSPAKQRDENENSEDEMEVDLSILSPGIDHNEESYVQKLESMKGEFDRLVRFVGSGLRGVARASGGEEAKGWDVLGEMIEAGVDA